MCALVNQLLDGGLPDLARGQEGGVTEKLKFFKKSKIAKTRDKARLGPIC